MHTTSISPARDARPDEAILGRGSRLPEDRERRHLAPLGLVAIAVGFNLWVLRAEILPVLNQNDSAVHLSMVRWAFDRMREGHLPLDGWYPYLGLGSPLFHHYQSLPHILTGILGLVVGPDRAFSGTLYFLLALFPISVYLGARLLGWERWVAAGAALISPLLVSTPGYGFEYGSYTWQGLGLWSQLWAMWLLPIACGYSWRAVSGKGKPSRYAVAALLIGITAALHFLTGYLAFLILGVWVLVRPGEFRKRIGRAVLVGIGALLIISWVIVPLLLDSRWISQSKVRQGTFLFDSFGAKRVLAWLFTGQLFDGHHFPIITLLVGVGTVVCIARFRHDERARALLGVMVLSLLLFFGRPTLGPLLKLLPGSADLLLHRYIMGVHLAGILLAGVGAAWLVPAVATLIRRVMPTVAPAFAKAMLIVLAFGLLTPAWAAGWTFDQAGGRLVQAQRVVDTTGGVALRSLVEEAQALGPGRIYAGSSLNWGYRYRLGGAPMYAALLGEHADDIGFLLRTTSLASDFEAAFDDSDPAQYDLFDVRYLILPEDRQPSVPATFVDRRDGSVLWQVPTSGYLDLIDTTSPTITADRTDLFQRTSFFMKSELLREGRYPTIAFAGQPAARPTLPPTPSAEGAPSDPPGSISSEHDALADGSVTAEVVADRPAVVLLKVSFDPRWTVAVDGVAATTEMVAPSFIGVNVPAGTHSIAFRYQAFPDYALLLAIGALTFLGLWIVPVLAEKKRSGRRPVPGELGS